MSITDRATEIEHRRTGGIFAAGVVASTVVLMPIHGWQMQATHAPYARAYAAIANSKAGAVFIDTSEVFYGNDLVRNAPFLRNSPLVFDFGVLVVAQVRELCSKFKVAVFAGNDGTRFGITATDPTKHGEYAELLEKKSLMQNLACGGEPLGAAD